MSASVLATTDAWVYVAFAYVAVFGLIGGFAAWVISRGRKISRQLPPEERTWM